MKGIAHLMIVLGTLSLVASSFVSDATSMVFGLGFGIVGLLGGTYILSEIARINKEIGIFKRYHC